jgi:hypothetical protein
MSTGTGVVPGFPIGAPVTVEWWEEAVVTAEGAARDGLGALGPVLVVLVDDPHAASARIAPSAANGAISGMPRAGERDRRRRRNCIGPRAYRFGRRDRCSGQLDAVL